MDDVAIDRIRAFEEQALAMHPDGYWLAYSGGKDSDVILDLAKRSGVKFEAVHNLTTVDPPEIVYHVRAHPEVRIDHPKETMWQLIRRKGMPPRRNARFCCEVLKERGGVGRIVITGIRDAESPRRAGRKMFEACYRGKNKFYLNPIKDWPTAAVWEYIHERGLPYCLLYDDGFKRLGCVLCPMVRNVERHMARWPKLCAQWERVVKSTFKIDKRFVFRNPQEYWEWWLDRDAMSLRSSDVVLFEDDPSMTEALADELEADRSSPAQEDTK